MNSLGKSECDSFEFWVLLELFGEGLLEIRGWDAVENTHASLYVVDDHEIVSNRCSHLVENVLVYLLVSIELLNGCVGLNDFAFVSHDLYPFRLPA